MAFRDELARKGIHLTSGIVPLAYWFGLPREWMLWICAGLIAIAVVLETLRRPGGPIKAFIDTWFGGMLRPFERSGITGATFVVLAGWLSIFLFSKAIAVAVLLILSISDSLASLIGSRFGKFRFLRGSDAGSAAFFVSAAIIALIFLWDFKLAALAGAAAATIVEAAKLRLGPYQLDDNLTVPLVGGAVMTLILPM